MEKKFVKYKWITLLSFAFMYNLVYLGRFNINTFMDSLSSEMYLSGSQQELISISVFISYAAGSFINGHLADKYGGKRSIITGGVMSALLNICLTFPMGWFAVLCISLANGYFQSMIWVGGISLLANWWKEGERGKGIGIANFFSGMSHATAYLIPVFLMAIWPGMEWRLNFFLPMLLLLLFIGIFAGLAVENPQHKNLKPYEVTNYRDKVNEEELIHTATKGKGAWNYFFTQKNFWWWCGIAMISSICRYGLLNWIPLYYDKENGTAILSPIFSNLMLPIGMAFGTLIITWIAGTKVFNNKGIIVTAMAAICGTLVMIFPMIDDSRAVLVGIFFTGFALYGINGILWLYAIDQGGRVFAGSAAGILNGCAYLGACLEGVLFPMVLKMFPEPMTVFVVMELLCICMVVCGMVVSKKNTVVVPEVRE